MNNKSCSDKTAAAAQYGDSLQCFLSGSRDPCRSGNRNITGLLLTADNSFCHAAMKQQQQQQQLATYSSSWQRTAAAAATSRKLCPNLLCFHFEFASIDLAVHQSSFSILIFLYKHHLVFLFVCYISFTFLTLCSLSLRLSVNFLFLFM